MDQINCNELFMELLLDCPAGTKDYDCPLNIIVNAPYEEKIDIIDRMTEDDIIQTIRYHNDCYSRRKPDHSSLR